MTTALLMVPDQNSYSTEDQVTVVSTQLDGGAPKTRKDLFGATSSINVQWTTDTDGYKYLRMFYQLVAAEGAIPFYCPLYLQTGTLRMYMTWFISGTFKLASQSGLLYVVTAQFNVEPIKYTSDDIAFMENYVPTNLLSIEDYALLVESGGLILTENGGSLNGGYDNVA